MIPLQKYMTLRLFAPHKTKIRLEFYPVHPHTTNPLWDDWHSYPIILRIYLEDAETLLLPYFKRIFPCQDPYHQEPQHTFDFCSFNWIQKTDWEILIQHIQNDMPKQTRANRHFYTLFIIWLSKALQYTDVIMVEGNL